MEMDIYQTPKREPEQRAYVLYFRALIILLCLIGVMVILRSLGAPTPSMLMLPAVLVAGLQWGKNPALFNAFLASLAYIFFFSPLETRPNIQIILHLTEILLVSVFVALLAGRSHNQRREAVRRQQLQKALRRLSHELAAAGGMEEVAKATVRTLTEQLDIESVLFVQREKKSVPLAASSPRIEGLVLTHNDNGNARPGVNRVEDNISDRRFFFYPLQSAGRIIGHLGLLFPADSQDSIPDQQALAGALTVTITAAMERELLAEKSVEADLLKRHEELYNAVLSSISHDFRTPLATIIGGAETLSISDGVLSKVARRDMLDMIREEAERLNRFVANLLDMTRLESDRLDPNFERVEVADIVGTAVGRAHRTLEGFDIEIDVAFDLPMVCVDFILIEHVLTNLLENAVKYSPEKGRIRIEAEANGEKVLVGVTDQGQGIPESELERIFEKFYRVRQGDARTAGTGLGLSICRGIIEAHGGTIRAFSPVYGDKGTKIVLSLPVETSLCDRKEGASANLEEPTGTNHR